MTNMHPLTDTQRKFAEEHHDLVCRYLRMRGLDMGEYYDIVIFRYLSAVQRYDEDPQLRERCAFKTIAYRGMRSALSNHFRDQRRQKRNAVVYSFDAMREATTNDSGAFAPHEYAEAREQWAQIKALATPRQTEALAMRADGYTNREIGKVYRIAPNSVSGRIRRLRKKARLVA